MFSNRFGESIVCSCSVKTLTVVLLLLVACIRIQTGVCFVQDTIPESGSTVIGGEGKSVSFYCRVLNEVNGTQVITEWFIERIDAGGSGPQTIVANPATNFEITGELLLNPVFAGQNYQTNLTIRRLSSDLDRANLSCGQGGTPPTIEASFILRIYCTWPPNLLDNLPLVAVEGSTNTVSLLQAPDASPFPQQFSWTVDGLPASNNSRVTFGYPSVTFQTFERADAGTYTLTATNYCLDNTSAEVGMDTGSFTLDVQYPPEFVGPEVDTQCAVLEGGNITLVCASGVNGNPTPTILWLDNNGSIVSDRTGISGAITLSLTVSGVTRYQAGNWTCTVANSPGGTPHSIQHQTSLTVVGISTDITPTTLTTNITLTTLSTGATVGITIGVTCAIILLVGVLAGVLLYYCISKQQSQHKPEPAFTNSMQQTDPQYEEVQAHPKNEVPATSGEEFELRENVAHDPVQRIELRDNMAYGPV